MNLEWISNKGERLLAIAAGLGFMIVALFNDRYRYFFLCVGIIAFVYAYKKFKKRDTPFERREREIRRKIM
jgi:4-hydroxybenzoate polyprenyltransferase